MKADPISNNFGDSLNWFKNIEFLESSDAETLKRTLASFPFAYRLLSIYAVGGKHYAWIAPDRPIIKAQKQTKSLKGN
jgi:hypothetical protein